MVQFQKLTRNLFLTLHGQNVHRQQRQLSKFLTRASFLNRARNSRCTVITDLDTSKRSTQKAFSWCDAILETGPAVSTSERTVGSAWETWTNAAADGVRCARVRWEINFLLTFETAPFICKHPVYVFKRKRLKIKSNYLVEQSSFHGHKMHHIREVMSIRIL